LTVAAPLLLAGWPAAQDLELAMGLSVPVDPWLRLLGVAVTFAGLLAALLAWSLIERRRHAPRGALPEAEP